MTKYWRKKLVEQYQNLIKQDIKNRERKSYIQNVSELKSLTSDIRKLEQILETLYIRELELKAIINKMREQ